LTTNTDIVNRALQTFGTRTTVTDGELAAGSTNEAIQANLILTEIRDDLLRMAPWDCALNYANLTYISSVPGTPENTSPATPLWQKGQPAPPWAYEYQYPIDCLRACFIIPANQTGFAGATPITTAVTGGAPAFWYGQPVKFKVALDQFYHVTAATVLDGGTGAAVGDILTLQPGPTTSPPIGAPAQLIVTAVSGGVITGIAVVNTIYNENGTGGSYFSIQPNPQVQSATTGSGTGSAFNLTWGPKSDQRVILTNQEFATLAYCRGVTDPNVMDTLFQRAWINSLGARLCMALTGDKALANGLIQLANADIAQARMADGNEGLTINDVTPDWLRIRGVNWTQNYSSPWQGFDWGGYFPSF